MYVPLHLVVIDLVSWNLVQISYLFRNSLDKLVIQNGLMMFSFHLRGFLPKILVFGSHNVCNFI